MELTVAAIFALVYLGMFLGGIPGLGLDRTGVALLGAIALVAAGRITIENIWTAVDTSTIALLFSLMIVSAQFRLSGSYSYLVRRVGAIPLPPWKMLGLVIAVTGCLSAVLANDIVCLAVAPVLIEVCSRRGFNPLPFLLGLACASNVGSAATLIGNPQNMLIGQVLGISFLEYMADALVPSVAGLGLVWAVITLVFRRRWYRLIEIPRVETPVYNRWQTAKGIVVLGVLILFFLFLPVRRDIVALAAAGVLMLSRRMRTREILSLVDWHLLVLFISLFVVNHCLRASGLFDQLLAGLTGRGIDLGQPEPLFAVSALLSNLVSNVPAVMLLLPATAHPQSAPILALSSTLAGNLLIVGSIANIIVVEQAAWLGVDISWRQHARIGIPVTLLTLSAAAGWLWLVSP
ncbi:MAG: anion transporter [Candidatus Glassbacteria bacterium]